MTNEFCSKCNALTGMTSSTTENKEKDKEGKQFKIITTSYHCSKCHAFVKSEDNRIPINSWEA